MKMGGAGGLVVLQYFLLLKKSGRTIYFRPNESSSNVLGSLVRYDHPGK